MNIQATIEPIKHAHGRGPITGYVGRFRDLCTSTHKTKDEARAALALLIAARANWDSTKIHVVTVRGHIGIFSYDLAGYVNSRHIWPEDGRISDGGTGGRTFAEAEACFRMHVAQITWDRARAHESDQADILPESKRREFRDWCNFQLRYRYAVDLLGLQDGAAHQWACDYRNQTIMEQEQAAAA